MKYISLILSGFSVVMCFVFAYYLAFTELLIEDLHDTPRMITIGVFLLYALLRIFRIIKLVKNLNA